MPFAKNSLSLLIETAANDIISSTRRSITESTALSHYNSIQEAQCKVSYGPEVVPIVRFGSGEYYTEMNFLYPFMRSAGIKSITTALDMVAEANNLDAKSVGLLIESETDVKKSIDKAKNEGKPKTAEKKIADAEKAAETAKKLKDKGYNVKRKQECGPCKECGKMVCECDKKR